MNKCKEGIYFYLPSLEGGGAERVTLNLIKALCSNEYTVVLVVSRKFGSFVKDLPNNIRIIDLKGSRIWLTIIPFIRLFLIEKPKLMVCGFDHLNLIPLLARWLSRARTKLIITIHIVLSEHLRAIRHPARLIINILIKKFFSKADRIVAVSNSVKKDISSRYNINQGVEVIYNPAIEPRIYQLASENIDDGYIFDKSIPNIISIGRLEEQKDFKTLIKAFSIVRRHMKSRLIIIGEGTQQNELRELIKKMGLSSDVYLLGFINNPYKYLKLSDLFVLSSKYEGLPTVLIEAIAFNLPLVVTDCPGGTREIIEMTGYHEKTLFVRVGDYLDLADSMMKALNKEFPQIKPIIKYFTVEYSKKKYIEAITNTLKNLQ